MKARIKKLTFFALAGCLLLAFSGSGFAREVWKEGTVTKRPWVETYQHIEIDHMTYTFMPKVFKITLPRKSTYGGRLSRQAALQRIREGQKVLVKVQGQRIYEIIIE